MDHDVVVVGGGIAGGALATALARAGLDVLLLERDIAHRDRVRGETVQLWGVEEIHRLGLEQAFLDAGGSYAGTLVPYDEVSEPAAAEAAAAPLGQLLPGVRGNLDVGHPQACEALVQAAAAAGATVRRGVRVHDAAPGTVRFEDAGTSRQARCRLVVGADGRHSVVRRRFGIGLQETAPRTRGGGLLVEGLNWPSDRIAIGTEGELHFFLFPRANGVARLYLMHDGATRRFAGSRAAAEFLEAWRFRCVPGSDAFPDARPAGPCAFSPMNDGRAERPCAPGVVLVGDAAGWNDPIVGQGLAIALRDARMVADVLRASGDWSPAAFAPYVEERRERMRRLHLTGEWHTDLYTTFTPAGAARRRAWGALWPADPVLGGPELALVLGPDRVAAGSFAPENLARMRAVA